MLVESGIIYIIFETVSTGQLLFHFLEGKDWLHLFEIKYYIFFIIYYC